MEWLNENSRKFLAASYLLPDETAEQRIRAIADHAEKLLKKPGFADKFYGYMDVFSWQNIHNPAISFSVQPTKTVKLQLDYHAFWLADTADAWYRANGITAVRPINKGADNFVGTELDFTATWKATKQLSFLVGYSHFFAGDYLKQTGSKASDDADFAYVQATFDF